MGGFSKVLSLPLLANEGIRVAFFFTFLGRRYSSLANYVSQLSSPLEKKSIIILQFELQVQLLTLLNFETNDM